MREICRAVRMSCPDLLLSVKMRMGFDSVDECEKWLPDWSADKNDAPDFFILHSRSVREGYLPVSELEHIKRSQKIISMTTQPVMLNGDINDVKTAYSRLSECGGASFMSGRGWLKNPYIFRKFEKGDFSSDSTEEKIYFYKKVLENAEKLKVPYNKGKQIELSQLMFAPDNPFFAELCGKKAD